MEKDKTLSNWTAAINILRDDCITTQKKGIHFILSSVVIWGLILIAFMTDWPIFYKNLAIFACSVLLMPLALVFSKILGIDFSNKKNPLTNLGIIFSVNQIVYILIAMWSFVAAPKFMIMIYAIIFGAHLMPYGWLYRSKCYFIASITIPLVALTSAIYCPLATVAISVWVMDVVFCIGLWLENRRHCASERETVK